MKIRWRKDRKLWSHFKSIYSWDNLDGDKNIGLQIKNFVTEEVPNKMKEENVECDIFEVLFGNSYGDRAIELSFYAFERKGLLLIQLPFMVRDRLDIVAKEIRKSLKTIEEE